MNHYRFHIGDYHAHTRHLSPSQDLAYRRLLDLYYLHERPLPVDVDECCRRACVDNAVMVGVILAEFFVLEADGWHNRRCDRELAAYREFMDKARRGGVASVEARRKLKLPSTSPVEVTTTTTTTNKEEKRALPRPALEEVKAYCAERKNSVDAQKFLDHYTANGWKVGKNPMKDWRAAVRTWERTSFAASSPSATPNAPRACGICGDTSGSGVHSQRGWRCMKHMGD